MKIRVIEAVCALFIVGAAAEAQAADKTRVYECDKFGNVTKRWDPPGAPAVGDRIRVKNLTVDKIQKVKYNGALKIALLPLGSTSGFIGVYALGDTITLCAKCDAGRDHLSCLEDSDLTEDGGVLDPIPGCEDCQTDVPTVSEWGLIVMMVLVLTVGTVVIARRRRPAAV